MRLGEYQELVCVKKVDLAYICQHLRLRRKGYCFRQSRIPDGVKQGDKLKVFVYKDSNDRLIATTNEPKLTLGGLAVLTVKEVTKIGRSLTGGLKRTCFFLTRRWSERSAPEMRYLLHYT